MAYSPHAKINEETMQLSLSLSNGKDTRRIVVDYSGNINSDGLSKLGRNLPESVFDYVVDFILEESSEVSTLAVPKNTDMVKLVSNVKEFIENAFPGSGVYEEKPAPGVSFTRDR